MGTPNFYNKNASKHFIIQGEWEDEEGNTHQWDSWEWDNQRTEIALGLKRSHGYDLLSKKYDNDRNFGGQFLAEKSASKYVGDASFIVCIKPIIRSGYYAHANLDYEIELHTGQLTLDYLEEGYDTIRDEVYDEILWYTDNVGLAKIHTPHVMLWIETVVSNLIDELEGFFTTVSEGYIRTAVASNGEAFYEKA
jgi:hypothetical protein